MKGEMDMLYGADGMDKRKGRRDTGRERGSRCGDVSAVDRRDGVSLLPYQVSHPDLYK